MHISDRRHHRPARFRVDDSPCPTPSRRLRRSHDGDVAVSSCARLALILPVPQCDRDTASSPAAARRYMYCDVLVVYQINCMPPVVDAMLCVDLKKLLQPLARFPRCCVGFLICLFHDGRGTYRLTKFHSPYFCWQGSPGSRTLARMLFLHIRLLRQGDLAGAIRSRP